MFTRLPSAVRNVLVALLVIVVMLVVKSHFERDDLDLPPHDEAEPPSVRIARDTQPTIVESNEDWLESARSRGVDEAPLRLAPASQLPPVELQPQSLPTSSLPASPNDQVSHELR